VTVGGEFARCMEENGVDVPDGGIRIEPRRQEGTATPAPPPPPDGVAPEAWEAALVACKHLGNRRTVASAESNS
jgi:hypothetical protein